MPPNRREIVAFAAALAALIGAMLADSIVGGKVLSPADVLRAQASFRGPGGAGFEPSNRLLIDPVLQFQPWLEFSRSAIRRGRLPLWNPLVGCGAPHLANGQSAVFDPFHAIAYLGRLPDAYAWMAAARLWTAGLGAFLLAGRWSMGRWGRWFAGLCFPLCGFLVAWLQFPVASVAAWLPWLLLATDRAIDRPSPRSIAATAAVVGVVLLGGHVQTSAHVLLAGGAYAAWMARGWRPLAGWSAGVALGVAVAAIEVLPLAAYLSRSPVWADRADRRPAATAIGRPRPLDAACTALPYLFGSQRRGHPNLARAVGVHNLNESAGGFAGLATLLWLAPIGAAARTRPARFLAALGVVGALAAFEVPPISNLLRVVPVLNVADNRRLTLWVAFALAMLGGIGLDRLPAARPGRAWRRALIAAAVAMIAAAAVASKAGPALRARAIDHYAKAAAEAPGADPAEYRARAIRQVDRATRLVPRVLLAAAAQALAMAALAALLDAGRCPVGVGRAALMALAIADLVAFGAGLNPAIDRADHAPDSAVIAHLRREVSPTGRIVSVGAELPPNTLMRYGLADARDYDSIELSRSVDRLRPLLDADPSGAPASSRRSISWGGVARSIGLLRSIGVEAVVAAAPPPEPSIFRRVDRVGAAWVALLDRPDRPPPAVDRGGGIDVLEDRRHPGIAEVSETFDPGWSAEVDGRPATVRPTPGGFLGVAVPAGPARIRLRYEPTEVRVGLAVSIAGLATLATIGCPLGRGGSRRNRPDGPWMARRGRVRIDPLDPSRQRPSPAPRDAEGRDADGPLLV